MLIFSENFKQFVKFFNNSAKITQQKIALSKNESNAKILSNSKQKQVQPKRQKIYETKIPSE
jgi:hypothetical protein